MGEIRDIYNLAMVDMDEFNAITDSAWSGIMQLEFHQLGSKNMGHFLTTTFGSSGRAKRSMVCNCAPKVGDCPPGPPGPPGDAGEDGEDG
ncbi:hypothetical protein AB6A40_011791, partial [Gnathostoma spinigerum]